jgi:hypothetical protein
VGEFQVAIASRAQGPRPRDPALAADQADQVIE